MRTSIKIDVCYFRNFFNLIWGMRAAAVSFIIVVEVLKTLFIFEHIVHKALSECKQCIMMAEYKQ